MSIGKFAVSIVACLTFSIASALAQQSPLPLAPNETKVAISDDAFIFSFPYAISLDNAVNSVQFDMGPGFNILSAWYQPSDDMQNLALLKKINCQPGHLCGTTKSRLHLDWTAQNKVPAGAKVGVRVFVLVHERDVPQGDTVDGIKVPPLPN